MLQVREDGKLDVTLRPPGAKAKISDGVERILEVLNKGKGRLNLGDKSNPKEIYAKLGMSKKVFKEAIGHMYKKRMLLLEPTQIRLQPADMWLTGVQMTKKEMISEMKEKKTSAEKLKSESKAVPGRGKPAAMLSASHAAGKSDSVEAAANDLSGETARRRSEVMKNLNEDIEWKKKEAAERLRQMKEQVSKQALPCLGLMLCRWREREKSRRRSGKRNGKRWILVRRSEESSSLLPQAKERTED